MKSYIHFEANVKFLEVSVTYENGKLSSVCSKPTEASLYLTGNPTIPFILFKT